MGTTSIGSVKTSNLSSPFLNRQGDNEETKSEMRCKKGILNTIVSGGMTNSASILLFFRESNLKFVIYDLVSLC